MSTDIPSTAVTSRSGCVMPAFVLLFAVGVLGVAYVASTFVRGGGSRDSFEAPLSRFAAGDPVLLSSQQLYVVRLASGDVVALDQRELRRQDAQSGCVIRYRETLQAGDRTGLFRSDCTGMLYDLSGAPLEGGGPPMRRHPVTVSGSTVKVDLKTCLDGPGGRVVPCRPQ